MQVASDDTSRRLSQPEPAREPQPKESPRSEMAASKRALPAPCGVEAEPPKDPDDEPPEVVTSPSKKTAVKATAESAHSAESAEASGETSSSVSDMSASATGGADSDE